ncbi:MAG: patatin-like phospholipase family protein [Alphaproteobacteria bacterium]|nr:patatin-like phospholipase family protein [Alphaproteobacteria bacterium]
MNDNRNKKLQHYFPPRKSARSSDSAISQIDPTSRPSFGLGLMGGGSWGAFTAGALEVLLPVLDSIGDIKIISGTSAGAINGAVATSGLNDKGAHEAVRRLKTVWDRVKGVGYLVNHLVAPCNMDFMLPRKDRWPNIPGQYLSLMTAFQAANPLLVTGVPQYLSNLVKTSIPDWKSVQEGQVKCAVNTVREHIFTGQTDHLILTGRDLTPDGVTASAALKRMGNHQIWDNSNMRGPQYVYRDGGYIQNPPLEPLIEANPTDIIMIILHDHTAPEADPSLALDKMYDREIHTDLARLTLHDSNLIRIHAIQIEMSDGAINGWHLNDTSKLNASPKFIDALYEAGRVAAKKWLIENRDHLGSESTYRPKDHAVAELAASGLHY